MSFEKKPLKIHIVLKFERKKNRKAKYVFSNTVRILY